jgi:DNA repair exonuclease SbcCD ATPase subunit
MAQSSIELPKRESVNFAFILGSLLTLVPCALSFSELYEKLCENLNLNEEDVNLLLQQGPFWPDCRATTNDCSIIDHLWMLTDQQTEFEEEKSSWEDEKSSLESQIKELKRIGGDNGEGWERLRSELKSLEEEQETLRDEKAKGEVERKELEREGKKKDEVIKGLEQRITAYEEATPISNGTWSTLEDLLESKLI